MAMAVDFSGGETGFAGGVGAASVGFFVIPTGV